MINIALIGGGFIGTSHADAIKKMDNALLKAVVDVNEESGKAFAQKHEINHYKTMEELFEKEEIDMVDICLPTFLHEEFVLKAAKNKKHVLCEKPITLTMESMDKMINECKANNVKFMVAQVLRFWPEYLKIKEIYDKGEFGKIKLIYASRLAQHPTWATWHKNPANSGGGLFDLHLHDIDILTYIFGEVDSVYAVGAKSDTGCFNHVTTSLKFKNGISAVAEGVFEMTENYPFTMSLRVIGSDECAEYVMKAGLNLEDIDSAQRSTYLFATGKEPSKLEIDEFDAYEKEIEYFVSCISKDEEISICSPESSKYVLGIILAIQKSLETGEVVKL